MAKKSPRCDRCGHPKGKHATGARGGCAVRVPRSVKGGRTQFRDCTCLYYTVDEDDETSEAPMTPAELIALDQARMAAEDPDLPMPNFYPSDNPRIYGDQKGT